MISTTNSKEYFNEIVRHRLDVYAQATKAAIELIKPMVAVTNKTSTSATYLTDSECKALFFFVGKIIDRVFDGLQNEIVPEVLQGSIVELNIDDTEIDVTT